MPHVARYFSQRAYDSSFETCLKKSKLDYSALCKKKDAEDYISLQPERGSPSPFSEPKYYGSHKGKRETSRATEDFLKLEDETKPGLSRNCPPGAQSRRESKPDYAAVCKKRNIEGYISLEAWSEREGSLGFSETTYYRSDKDEHERTRGGEDFLNGSASQEKLRSSSNYSFEAYGRRESKPYYSASCKKTDTEEYISLETQSEKSSSPGFSETGHYESDDGEYEKPRIIEDCLNGLDESKSRSCGNTTEARSSTRVDSNKKQKIVELSKADNWKNNSSEIEFSETSTAFIGPLYPPPPKVESVISPTCNENSKSPSFRISTVVSDKGANRTKVEDGINYELRQFYKELHELEAEADAHNIIETTANSQQHFSSLLSNAPTVHQVRDPPGQQSSSQPSNTLPSKPSVLIPPSYLPNESAVSPAEFHTLPPINKQEFYNRPVPLDKNNYFVSQTLPPQCSGCPPPQGVRCPPPQGVGTQGFGCLPPPGVGCPPPQGVGCLPLQGVGPQDFGCPPQGVGPQCFGCPPPPRGVGYLPPQGVGPQGVGCSPPRGVGSPPPQGVGCPPPQGFRGPPPDFQRPPPPTFVHNVPLPPRHNNPLIFPRGDNIHNLSYHENEKYHIVNDDHPQPTSQVPWHSTHVPPESRFCPKRRGHTESFPRTLAESSQAYQQEGFCEQKSRHFNQIRLQGDTLPHEQYPPRFRDEAKCTDFKRKLVMLRGVPGSGKSTLARILLDRSPDGIVFSTDDYFCQENGYTYDVKLLGDAHSWNQNRARRAIDDGRSPIIIDNTNIQGWEMKPYVQMAIESGYSVEFLEPNTWWKLDPHELERRNTHRVPREKISQMLERFEHDMNVRIVMNSLEPRRVRSRGPPPEARQR